MKTKVNTTVNTILGAGNYAVIPQHILRDQRLSANALRLLICMINNEAGFKKQHTTYFGDILGWCNDTVVKYSKELDALGYMKRVTTANPGKGKGFTHTYVFSTVSAPTESVGTESVPTETVPTESNNNIIYKSAPKEKTPYLSKAQLKKVEHMSFVSNLVQTNPSYKKVEINPSSTNTEENKTIELETKTSSTTGGKVLVEEDLNEVEKKESENIYVQLKKLNGQKIENREQLNTLFNYLKKLYENTVDDIFDVKAATEALRQHFISLDTQNYLQDNNVVKSWHSYLLAGVEMFKNKYLKKEEEKIKSKQRTAIYIQRIQEENSRILENQKHTTSISIVPSSAYLHTSTQKETSLSEEQEALKTYTIEGLTKLTGTRYGR
jgi:hypothetical protein